MKAFFDRLASPDVLTQILIIAFAVVARGLEAAGDGIAAVRTVAVDAALAVRTAGVDIGAYVEAAAGELPGDPDGLQRRVALGFGRELGAGSRVLLEVQRRGEEDLAGVAGLAWEPSPAFAAFGGIRQDPPGVAWGLSAGTRQVRAEAAAVHVESLGPTLQVGLRFVPPG